MTGDSVPKFEIEPSSVALRRKLKLPSVRMTPQKILVVVVASLALANFALSVMFQMMEDSSNFGYNDIGKSLFETLISIIVLAIYFVPSAVAMVREHQNKISILVLNSLLGWTFFMWVICLAWAFTSDVRESRQYIRQVVITDPKDKDV